MKTPTLAPANRGLKQFAIIVALQLVCSAHAQTPPMHFQHLGLREGLSQSTVTSMLQDSYGFLWLATENGLNRYDGHSLSHYYRDRHDAEGLASDFIWTIAQDARGDLWLATVGGGVARWDRARDRFERFRHDPDDPGSIASNDIRSLLIDRRGRIWIGTLGQGLDRLDPETGEVVHFRHDPDNARSISDDSIYVIHEDRSGQLWIGTKSGLNRFAGEGDDFVRYVHDASNAFSLSHDHVLALLEDHQGVLWVGTAGGGLNKLDRTTGRFSHLRHDPEDPGTLSDDHVRALLEDESNRVWVGTSRGLNLLERRTASFTRYRNDPTNRDSLADDYVMSLYQDRSGLLWVGTQRRGVSRWNPRSWSLGHYNDDWLQSTNVASFADDGNGRLWVGTFGDGLRALDMLRTVGNETPAETVAGLPEDHIMSLLLDEQDTLWIGGMSTGLSRLDTATGELVTYRHDANDTSTLSANGVMTLYQDQSSDIWVGTFGGGINRLNRETGTFERYAHSTNDPTGLSASRATSIVEDPRGVLWVGTDGGGLNMLDLGSGRFSHFRHDADDPTSLSADTVYSLHIDAAGTLWIGTAGGGLDKLVGDPRDPGSIHFSESAFLELPSNVIYGIQSDHEGGLWLSSNNGLSRYTPASGELKTFHRSHGAQSEEFNFGAHHKGKDGRLYFGGANGFNAFYPGDLEESAHVPSVVLTAVEKLHQPLSAGQPYHLTQAIDLSYRDNVITFEYAALDFTAPDENRYSYWLEGFDDRWTKPSNLRRATYTNLAGGDYVFHVKAANSDGLWNETALTILISVAPAPWNTVWARGFYAAVLLLVLILAWRSHLEKLSRETAYSQRLEEEVRDRTKQLEEQNVELERLSRTKSEFLARMSHEVRTPMNGVLGMAELMLGTRLNHQQQRFTQTIHESAKSLLEIIDDILDYSKIEAGRLVLDEVGFDLRELVEETIELLAGRAQEKGLELMCHVPARLSTDVVGDPLRLRQVLINLVGNAVKFTEHGEVLLGVHVLEETVDTLSLRFEISDTGIGIEDSHQRMIFEVFSQKDASTTRRYGGTGLGLAICKQLVALMGGDLSVESEPGSGSTFSFTATLVKQGEPAPSLATQPVRLPALRALIVDPSDTQRQIIGEQLSALGVDATESMSAGDAMARLRGAAGYDVAIIALNLPDGSGAELCREIRADQELLSLRLILLSPMATRFSMTARKELRIDSHLVKPLRRAVLSQTLSVLFGQGGNHDEPLSAPNPARPTLAGLRKRLLLVEDNAVNEAVAVGMLDELDCRVHVARDGQAALDRFQEQSYDAILMDCQLPVMDGFQATARIRAEESRLGRPRAPIIALTANAVAGERNRCLEAGMDDYVSKPFTLETLRETLGRWLRPADSSDYDTSRDTPILDAKMLDNIRSLETADRPDLLERIIRIYLSDSAKLIEELRTALNTNDSATVRRAAHSLKSSSANVGAHVSSELCQELERLGARGMIKDAWKPFRQLSDVQPRVVAALQLEIEQRSA